MIALIKSATLFLSLRVRLYEREGGGGLEQSLCTVNMSLELGGGGSEEGPSPEEAAVEIDLFIIYSFI